MAITFYVPTSEIVYTGSFLTGGIASVSSEFSAIYNGDRCVDGNLGSRWQNVTGATFPHWWKYDLGGGVTKIVKKLRICGYPTNYGTNGFSLQGSNNNSDWDTLYTGNGTNESGVVWMPDFFIDNSVTYRYYRMWITSNHGAATTDILVPELEMMEIV